eukprot:6137633-Pyramimonas_sp.AAC.1
MLDVVVVYRNVLTPFVFEANLPCRDRGHRCCALLSLPSGKGCCQDTEIPNWSAYRQYSFLRQFREASGIFVTLVFGEPKNMTHSAFGTS